jgi:pimeloyl-ACP methyl ester carboxylesterase
MINFNVYKNGKLFEDELNKEYVKINKPKILFIFHGLYGRGKNWQSYAKKYSLDIDQLVITVDLRNHGGNEFKKNHSYLLMAEDIIQIIDHFGFIKVDLLGHSMGGKLAMVFTLLYQNLVNQLIVADIAPVKYNEDNQNIIDILLGLDLYSIKNRNHADEMLYDNINEKFLRTFLLQNLELVEGKYKWSINLEAIKNSMIDLRSFPNFDHSSLIDNKILCIYGEKSNYVKEKYFNNFKNYFSNITFQKIEDAGHFLHVEKASEFYEKSLNFFKN